MKHKLSIAVKIAMLITGIALFVSYGIDEAQRRAQREVEHEAAILQRINDEAAEEVIQDLRRLKREANQEDITP